MAVETIVLDPSEVSNDRTALDITPWIDKDGLDWGNAEIAAYMAEQATGQAPVDFRVPNRTISGNFVFSGTVGGTTTVQARSKIQAKLALIQREGGWLKRVTASGGTVYADLVNASAQLTSIAGWESRGGYDASAPFTLEAIPDFYGDEQTFSAHSETTLPEVIFTETGTDGDIPGRTRIIVTEQDADDQLGLLWGIRSRNYSADSTARLAYQAEALGALDTTAATAVSGASGGTVFQHANLSTSWTPVMSTNVGGTQYLTHVGSYKVWARLRSVDGSAVTARFVYDVGDMTLPAENDAWTFPGASQFYMADLGEIRLDEVPIGTHRWQGVIQAHGTIGGEDIQVDRIWFQPLDEFAGLATAPFSANTGFATFLARDEFNQSVTGGSDPLSGLTLPVGGTWSGAGDADDFVVEDTGHTAQRTAVSDSVGTISTGRAGIAGTGTATNVVVQTNVKVSALTSGLHGVFARYVDINNFVAAGFVPATAPNPSFLSIRKVVGGVETQLTGFSLGTVAYDVQYTVVLRITAAGTIAAWCVPVGRPLGDPQLFATDSDYATGGTLASGKVGIYDRNTLGSASTRTFNDFAAFVPATDAAVFANRIAELRTDGCFRQDSAGNAYGPITRPAGDTPRLPQAGLENRTVEVLVKGSRGDFDQLPDSGIDDLQVQVKHRPSWLFVNDT